MMRFKRLNSPLGQLVLIARGGALSGLYCEDQNDLPPVEMWGTETNDDPLLEMATQEINEFFRGERTKFTVPFAPSGGDFEQRVWIIARHIPYGSTQSHAQVASLVGQPREVEAVAQALESNPLRIVIPTHRIRSDARTTSELDEALRAVEGHVLTAAAAS